MGIPLVPVEGIPTSDGVVTPGWSDPARDKLPYFRLPDDMTGLRVLDVGCAEGYFSFEAERREPPRW
jgi:tRNA (mo5U34)-methyltransferase